MQTKQFRAPTPPASFLPREHLIGEEAPMGEGREIRGTGRSLGQTSQGIDLTGPSILVKRFKIRKLFRMQGVP